MTDRAYLIGLIQREVEKERNQCRYCDVLTPCSDDALYVLEAAIKVIQRGFKLKDLDDLDKCPKCGGSDVWLGRC